MDKQAPDFVVGKNDIAFRANPRTWPLEAVMNAAYFFIEDFYVFMDKAAGGNISVSMKSKKSMGSARLRKVAGELQEVLFTETLRLDINKRNTKLREKTLKQAMDLAMSPPPQEQDAGRDQSADMLELDEELKKIIEKTKGISYEEDPLGIGMPVTDEPPAASKKRVSKKKK